MKTPTTDIETGTTKTPPRIKNPGTQDFWSSDIWLNYHRYACGCLIITSILFIVSTSVAPTKDFNSPYKSAVAAYICHGVNILCLIPLIYCTAKCASLKTPLIFIDLAIESLQTISTLFSLLYLQKHKEAYSEGVLCLIAVSAEFSIFYVLVAAAVYLAYLASKLEKRLENRKTNMRSELSYIVRSINRLAAKLASAKKSVRAEMDLVEEEILMIEEDMPLVEVTEEETADASLLGGEEVRKRSDFKEELAQDYCRLNQLSKTVSEMKKVARQMITARNQGFGPFVS